MGEAMGEPIGDPIADGEDSIRLGYHIESFFPVPGRRALPVRARLAVHGLLAAALLQAGLGISTVVLIMPVALAALHQANGIALLTMAVWTVFELRALAAHAAAPVAYRRRSSAPAG